MHKEKVWTTVRITEDVRDWINELVEVLAENQQKPSLTQNEAIRWMCKYTVTQAAELYRENYSRIVRTHTLTSNPLNVKELRDAYGTMWEELEKLRGRK